VNEDFWIRKLRLKNTVELKFDLVDSDKLIFLADIHLPDTVRFQDLDERSSNEKQTLEQRRSKSNKKVNKPEEYSVKFKLFQDFLTQINENVKAIFLLGDFFNYYVGEPQEQLKSYQDIFDQFRKLADKGTKIFFISGNRDFLVRNELSKFGIIKLPTWAQIKVNQTGKSIKILLTHGDILAYTERMYRLFRMIITSTEIHYLTKCFSFGFRGFIARFLRKTISADFKNQHELEDIKTDIELIKREYHKAFCIPFELNLADIMIIGHWHMRANFEIQDLCKCKSYIEGISEGERFTESCKNKKIHIIGDWRETQGAFIEFSNGEIFHCLFP